MEERTSLIDPARPVQGHEPFTSALAGAIHAGRVAHGWILAGPRGTGKSMMACLAAAWLMREGGALDIKPGEFMFDPGDPGSNLVAQGAHPDFMLVRPEEADNKSGQIKIEQIRKLKAFMTHKPARGGWRVAIIDSMDEVNRNAQNALLKLLEEPPDKAMLFLVSSRPGQLLPTIRSRCRVMRIAGVSGKVGRGLVEAELGDVDGARLDDLVRLGEGAPGRAVSLAASQSDEFYQQTCKVMAGGRLDEAGLLAICGKWVKGGAAGQEARRGASWLVARLLHLAAMTAGLGEAGAGAGSGAGVGAGAGSGASKGADTGAAPGEADTPGGTGPDGAPGAASATAMIPELCAYEKAVVRKLVANHGADRLAEMHMSFTATAQRMDGLHLDFAHFLHRELVQMHRKSLP